MLYIAPDIDCSDQEVKRQLQKVGHVKILSNGEGRAPSAAVYKKENGKKFKKQSLDGLQTSILNQFRASAIDEHDEAIGEIRSHQQVQDARLDALEGEQQRQRQNVETLNGTVAGTVGQQERTQTQLNSVTAQVAQLLSAVAALKGEVDAEKGKLQNVLHDLHQAMADIIDNAIAGDNLKKLIARLAAVAGSTIKELNEFKAAFETRIAKLSERAQQRDISNRLALEGQIDDLNVEVDRLNTVKNQVTFEVTAARNTALARLKEEIEAKAAADIASVSAELDSAILSQANLAVRVAANSAAIDDN